MEQSPSWEADQFSQLTKKFSAFYGTRKFFTVLTSARHLSLSWANSIQSPRPPPTSWKIILILSSHLRLGLPNGLFILTVSESKYVLITLLLAACFGRYEAYYKMTKFNVWLTSARTQLRNTGSEMEHTVSLVHNRHIDLRFLQH
jgi:hypothetical protein